MTLGDALDQIQLVANSLADIAAIGISPAVDARRLGADLETHLLDAALALLARARSVA